MKPITPIIKKTRVVTTRYEVCPHCNKEIVEKSTYMDDENYVYHRPCVDKGPIDKITPASTEEVMLALKNGGEWFNKTFNNVKSAQIQQNSGVIDKNIAGQNYSIRWEIDPITNLIKTFQPEEMPDYMWNQIKEAMNSEANVSAHKLDHLKSASASNWLVRAAENSKASDDKNEIDDGFLADGLGAFLDVFVNYHSGPEGDKLAKWVIQVCKDPKYEKVADKLQKFHKLMGEIYEGVTDIAKNDDNTGKKLASIIKKLNVKGN